jgi:tetratricopeptide (TPR) repeat protein
MKRIFTLLFLCIGLTAVAQNRIKLDNSDAYEHFKELRNENDTLRMKQMLDDWGAKDPEYYAAWSNYCSVKAETAEDPSWLELAVNWIEMGLEEYPENLLLTLKYPQALFDDERFQETLPLLLDLEEKGLDDPSTWYYLGTIYGLNGERELSRRYLDKMVREGDENDREYAKAVLEVYDESDHVIDSLLLVPDHAVLKEFAQTAEFQQLVERFAACDTTLTREEIANVYYGSAYKKDYNRVSSTSDGVQELVEEGKVQEAVDALQARLRDYPVSLFLLVSIFNLSEDPAVLEPVVWKAQKLLSAIDNSGLGTPECPMQAICVNDEYQVLGQVAGMQELVSQELIDDTPLAPLDRMTFINPFGLEQTYFFYLTPPYWERLNALAK